VREASSAPGGRRIARNTALRLIAEVVSKVALLALFAVMARELGRARFGDFAVAVSLAILLMSIGGLGTDTLLTRRVARGPGQVATALGEALAVKLVVGVAGLVVMTAIAVFGEYPAVVRTALLLIAASSLVELLTASAYAVFQGLDDLAPEATGRILQSIVRAGLGVPVLLIGGGLAAVAVAYLVGSLVALIYSARLVASRISIRRLAPSAAGTWALARASLPIAIGGLFEVLAVSLNTVVLSAAKGSQAAGLFGAGTRLVDSTLFIGASFTAAMLPTLARAGQTGAPSLRQVYELACKVIVAVLMPISAAFVFFSEPLTELILGSSFSSSSSVVQLVGATPLLTGIGYLSVDALIAQNRQSTIPWITASAAAVDVILLIVLVPSHAVDGAAVATLASAATYAALSAALVTRLAGGASLRRIALVPVIGALVVATIAMVGLDGLLGFAIAMVAYALMLPALERALNPADFRWAREALRARGAALVDQSSRA
jgi:O-antigen/teichoic acid export membrane protein